MVRPLHALALGLVLALLGCADAAASRGRAGRVISTHVRPGELKPGRAATIYGTLTGGSGAVVGELLELQASDGPGARFGDVAHTWTLAGGRYRFTGLRSAHDVRYRV